MTAPRTNLDSSLSGTRRHFPYPWICQSLWPVSPMADSVVGVARGHRSYSPDIDHEHLILALHRGFSGRSHSGPTRVVNEDVKPRVCRTTRSLAICVRHRRPDLDNVGRRTRSSLLSRATPPLCGRFSRYRIPHIEVPRSPTPTTSRDKCRSRANSVCPSVVSPSRSPRRVRARRTQSPTCRHRSPKRQPHRRSCAQHQPAIDTASALSSPMNDRRTLFGGHFEP